MLTVYDVKDLSHGTILYHQTMRDSRNQPLQVRVSGKCQLWKRDTTRFKIPVKHGLYENGYITNENSCSWCLTEEHALLHPLKNFGDWNRFTSRTGMRPEQFICNECKKTCNIPKHPSHETGYSILDDKLVCYPCTKKTIENFMIKHGRVTLYLKENDPPLPNLVKEFGLSGAKELAYGRYSTKDWCGAINYVCQGFKHGYHNIARKRLDVWFKGPDNFIWHGVNYGDSELCHCKKTKRKRL